jgi:hypothetical protein
MTVTVNIVDTIDRIIEEKKRTCVNMRCSRVNQNAILMFTTCQKKDEKGITKSQ